MTVEHDVLRVDNLDLAYRVRGRDLPVLRDLSFRVGPGEAYGLVGESGCGKSTAALAVVRYLPPNGRVRCGRIWVDGRDVIALGAAAIRRLRATTVSMVYQDPARALNPTLRVGTQLTEIFRARGHTAAEAAELALVMLKRLRIGDAESVVGRYPHQLSGGMQQRVVIAMALAIDPKLLILDEPTTGLDATLEAEILNLITTLRLEFATAILFISHNLAMISRMCERVGVLYAGALIEEGTTTEVFRHPRHPYTVGLMRSIPRRGQRKDHGRLDSIPGLPPAPGEEIRGCLFGPRCELAAEKCRTQAPPPYEIGARLSRCHFHERASSLPHTAAEPPAATNVDRSMRPLLRVVGVSKTFGTARAPVRVLHDLTLELRVGETLGLVGESGSGKSTLARLILGLLPPDPGGVVELDGGVLAGQSRARTRGQLQSLQMVFQNPAAALNRSYSARRLIGRALGRLAGVPKTAQAARLLELTRSVRLADRYLNLRPGQLSGGLQQRVAIARTFAGEPRIVICDEPTSALDVSIQAAILNLLTDLQAAHQVSYLFISHDLAAVRYVSDRIAVLYRGRLMEVGPAEQVFSGPHHPYTHVLLSAVPELDDPNDGAATETSGRGAMLSTVPGSTDPAAAPGDVRGLAKPGAAALAMGGCVFHPRCPRKIAPLCEQQEPPLYPGAAPGHEIRCHIPVSGLQ